MIALRPWSYSVNCHNAAATKRSSLTQVVGITITREIAMKEKSLPLAIGLNLLLPGIAYMYMRKWVVGIFACLLVVGIYATTGLQFAHGGRVYH